MGPIDAVEVVGFGEGPFGDLVRFRVVNSTEVLRCGLEFQVSGERGHSYESLRRCGLDCLTLRCIWKQYRHKDTGKDIDYPVFFVGQEPK